jgi:hypothetical protein
MLRLMRVDPAGLQSPKPLQSMTAVVIAGSLFAWGNGWFFAAAFRPGRGGANFEMREFFYLSSFVCLFFGMWGLATGIGLHKRWRWARVSMLFFSGLVICICALGVVMAVSMARDGSGSSTGEVIAVSAVLLATFLTPLGLGLWCVVYLRSAAVKELFLVAVSTPHALSKSLRLAG